MSCQNILTTLKNISDVELLSKYYISSMFPIQQVIVITSLSSNAITRKALPIMDMKINIQEDNGLKMTEYKALKDARWRMLNVAYLEWRPFVFKNTEGKVVGITYDIWKLIAHKVGFTMSFSPKGSYSEMYQHVANGTADFAMPSDSFSPSMLEVHFKKTKSIL